MLSFTDLAVTVVEAETYATARGWTEWAGDATHKEAALRRGQDYIAGLYNARWPTEWDNAEAPDVIKFAIVEAARQELASPGSLAPVIAAGPQKVLTGVKGITWQVVNDGSGRRVAIIPAVEALLADLVTASTGNTVVTSLLRY